MSNNIVSENILPGNRLGHHGSSSAKNMSGQIQMILGPMFSGKSTELIRRLKRLQIAKYKCLTVKYSKDMRYDPNDISTHDQVKLKASIAVNELNPIREMAENYEVIGIDEGQFYPDISSFSEDMANAGKIVIIAALDGTFQRKPFENIVSMIPHCEKVEKLNAICMFCYGEAAYTKRTTNDTEIEVIGGSESYMAACRKCHLSSDPSKPTNNKASASSSPRIPLKQMNGDGDNIDKLLDKVLSPKKSIIMTN